MATIIKRRQRTATKARFCEHVLQEDTELRIDEEAGIIHNVRVLGKHSKNGRVYADEAIDESIGLTEGATVNLDHQLEGDHPRAVLDGWGQLKEVKRRGDATFGQLHYLKEHPATPVLIERAKRFPKSFGLSHTASGRVRPGRGDQPDVVESLEEVESVDVVSKPATNAGLFESERRRSRGMGAKNSGTAGSVLEQHRGAAVARLRKLLEADDFAAMADAPIDAEAPTETAEDAVQASIEALVLAVLRDDGLDPAGQIAKIKAILGMVEKVNNAGTSSGDASGGSEGGDAGGDSTSTSEALLKTVARLERRELVRDLMEEVGVVNSDLSAKQRQALAKATDEDSIRTLLEAYASGVTRREDKPSMGRKFTESTAGGNDYDSGGNYDDALVAARGRRD